MKVLVTHDFIADKILIIRGKKVMMVSILAELYGVKVKVLTQAVKRNIERFPEDFMFRLSKDEYNNLKSQIVTSSWGGIRKLPVVFTEQGVAMLSSVLSSKRAVQVNIQIMRVFAKLREILSTHKELQAKIDKVLRRYGHRINEHDQKIAYIFKLINELLDPPEKKKSKKYGFITGGQ